MTHTLPTEARRVIEAYRHLQIGAARIVCPYFNNKLTHVRAGLRVQIGKGSPKDIEEEAILISFREHIDLSTASKEDVYLFLTKHHLGVDCSGFVYHILDTQSRKTKNTSLAAQLAFPYARNIVRKLLVRLRPVENTNAATLTHPRNATAISVREARPLDLIKMNRRKKIGEPDHIALITDVICESDRTVLSYVHALKWRTDRTNKGDIRTGTIVLPAQAETLDMGEWTESGCTGLANETYILYSESEDRGIVRLRACA